MRLGWKTASTGLLASLVAGVCLAFASPAPSDPVLRHAAELIEWGRAKEARALVSAAVARPENQHNAALIAYAGHLAVMFGDLTQGLQLTKQALALDENCAPCHLYRFEAMAERAKGMRQFRALLQLPKLKGQLNKAEQLDPSLGDVQWAWIDLDLQLPAAVGGSVKDAYARADKLAALDPVDGDLARASIAMADHKPDQALADFRSAAAKHSDDPRGVFALGQALYLRGAYSDAAPYLARAQQMNGQSALYSGYAAAVLARQGKLEAARTVLDEGAKEHPESRLGDYLVAQALVEQRQDFSWAKQLLDAYLEISPEPGQPDAKAAQQLLQALG